MQPDFGAIEVEGVAVNYAGRACQSIGIRCERQKG